ncbi:WG repeat-containing protein, partial [Campylobacter coli]|nr:WG repeat-containing protein [Campylobacter coli]
FREGLASVGLNGKYGFIDKSGKIVIEPIFDDIDY